MVRVSVSEMYASVGRKNAHEMSLWEKWIHIKVTVLQVLSVYFEDEYVTLHYSDYYYVAGTMLMLPHTCRKQQLLR